jgi:hypothetical protein
MSNLSIISTSPNPAVAQQTDLVNALVTAVQAVPVTPPVVIVVPLAPASTNYTYAVVAKLGTQTVPATVTITTGAATLSATASNTISWNTIPGAVYDVYRVTGGANQGKIASNLTPNVPNGYGGVLNTLATMSVVDAGLSGDSTAAPTFNTTGTLAHGAMTPDQVVNSATAVISIITGTVLVTYAGVAAMTLGTPVAGPASAGGQDGAELLFITTTTNQHTVTTPANVINGNKHILTFAATANSQLSLEAHGGIWYYANAVNAAVAS